MDEHKPTVQEMIEMLRDPFLRSDHMVERKLHKGDGKRWQVMIWREGKEIIGFGRTLDEAAAHALYQITPSETTNPAGE